MIWVLVAAVIILILTLFVFGIGSIIISNFSNGIEGLITDAESLKIWNFFKNIVWAKWPLVILIGLIIWIVARAQKKEYLEEYYQYR